MERISKRSVEIMEDLLIGHWKCYISIAVHPVCPKAKMLCCGLDTALESLYRIRNADGLPLCSERATNVIHIPSGCPPRKSIIRRV